MTDLASLLQDRKVDFNNQEHTLTTIVGPVAVYPDSFKEICLAEEINRLPGIVTVTKKNLIPDGLIGSVHYILTIKLTPEAYKALLLAMTPDTQSV
jgi:hypothetical protein